nr:hypothetical protein [Bradyrhizobium sp. CCBAU 51765]
MRSVLSARSDLTILASCGDAASCSEAMRLLVPDVALVDAAMPNIGVPGLLALARTAGQGTRVVLFADAAGVSEPPGLAAPGSCLVLTKEAKPEMLVATLRKVAQNQRLAPRRQPGPLRRRRDA